MELIVLRLFDSFLCFVRCCDSLIFYLFYIYNSNTTVVTCGAGTTDLSGAPEFTPVFSDVRVARSLIFCVLFCRSFFVLFSFLFAIVLSVLLRFTASEYTFGILKPSMSNKICVVRGNEQS